MKARSSSRALIQSITLLVGLLLASSAVFSQDETASPDKPETDYAAAISKADEDLKAILAELAAQRNQIAEERPALSKDTNTIAAELREKRRLAEVAR